MIVDWLIRRAKRTPYFHLSGYMERWWLVPYRRVIERQVQDPFSPEGETITVNDGTGPVSLLRRPFAWMLQRLGVAVRVHHILRSDVGRDPHDHPWWFVTVILRGGYAEWRFDADGELIGGKWHGPGSVLIRRPTDLHMLKLPPGGDAWTLFMTGPKKQTWGFKPRGCPKIPYTQYQGGQL